MEDVKIFQQQKKDLCEVKRFCDNNRIEFELFPKDITDNINDYTKVVYVLYGSEVMTTRGKWIQLNRCIIQRNIAVGYDKEENILYVKQWIK